jgi:hypothetical protein
MVVGGIGYSMFKGDKIIDEDNLDYTSPCYFTPNETTGMWFTIAGISFLVTCLISTCLFVFVEK